MSRLVKAGEEVSVLAAPLTSAGTTWPAGTIHVRAKASTRRALDAIAKELGVSFAGTSTRVPAGAARVRPQRIGLWDQYGGSMPSGWTRWILEQFEVPFERVFPPTLDAGNLNARFDALVFVDGAITPPGPRRGGEVAPIPDLPAEYRGQEGRVTAERTLPKLREFIENGGTVLAIGESAMNLSNFLALPITDHMVENGTPLARTQFYVPGSLLHVRVDTTHPVAHGMPEMVDVFFDDSPVFRLGPDAAARGVRRIAWFDTAAPLRSGWAWGEKYLEGGTAAVEARVGRGRVLLFGPQILQRAQPHGTFKFLFNGVLTP
jgi:hypothetical protein